MKRLFFLSNWRRRILFYLLVTLAFAAAIEIIRIRTNSLQKLAAERNRKQLQNVIPFERLELPQHFSENVRFWQNTDDTRDLVKFRENYFAATGGGLHKFSPDGKIIKHFTILDGLPESDLTKLAVFKDRLFIGTKSKNLVEFDGEKFARFKWTNLDSQAVTAFFNDGDNKLLIGTFNGGLIEFDGQDFREIKAENKRIGEINCIYKKDSLLFVGTFDDGLWISDAGNWRHFTNADDLTSNRVVAIVENDENIFAATDLGLSVISLTNSQLNSKTVATLPIVSDLIKHDGKLFLTRDDGEIYEVFRDKKENFGIRKSSSAKQENLSGARFAVADDKLFLTSNKGIHGAKDFKSFAGTNENSLTDNFVSSIAFDAGGNLWAGTFRSGVDVFSADWRKSKHFETETLREVNALLFDAEKKKMLAATSNGAFNLDGNSQISQTNGERLPSNSIMHISGGEKFFALATSKGLLTGENGKIRVYSTFNGLPNNNIYATAFDGKSLFVGTLGGLAEIEDGKIARVFKDSNSNLKQNWVTALAFAGKRLFIGTYGGGIFELTASGEIRSFENEAGKFVVNPNALFSDGERLYAGTLDGVRVLDFETQNWTILRKDLPSEAVFAVAGNSNKIFFGTTNGIAEIDKNYFESGANE